MYRRRETVKSNSLTVMKQCNTKTVRALVGVAKVKHQSQAYTSIRHGARMEYEIESIKMPGNIWASPREKSSVVCEQQRRRPACAYAQSDQRLCYSLIVKYHIQA